MRMPLSATDGWLQQEPGERVMYEGGRRGEKGGGGGGTAPGRWCLSLAAGCAQTACCRWLISPVGAAHGQQQDEGQQRAAGRKHCCRCCRSEDRGSVLIDGDVMLEVVVNGCNEWGADGLHQSSAPPANLGGAGRQGAPDRSRRLDVLTAMR